MNEIIAIIIIISLASMLGITYLAWNKATRWVAVLMIPLICSAIYFSWEGVDELRGQPTTIRPSGEFQILAIVQDPPRVIWILIKPSNKSTVVLVEIPWTEEDGEEVENVKKQLKDGIVKLGKFKGDQSGRNNIPGSLEIYDFKDGIFSKK